MDITIELCKITNKFGISEKTIEAPLYKNKHENLTYKEKEKDKIIEIPQKPELDIFVDNIGKSIFDNWETIIWSNIDGVFDISEYHGGYIKQQTDRYYSYFDFTDTNSRWNNGRADYILYRYFEAFGYTISSNKYYKNEDNLICVGNGYDEVENVIYEVNIKEPYGVYLFISDRIGNIDDFMTTSYVMSKILRKNKHGVILLPSVWSKKLENIIYILSNYFKYTGIIRPITSNKNQSYLILKNYIGNCELPSILNAIIKNGLTDVIINDNFYQWLNQIKEYLLNSTTLEGEYDYFKCLLLWNMPDNPENF